LLPLFHKKEREIPGRRSFLMRANHMPDVVSISMYTFLLRHDDPLSPSHRLIVLVGGGLLSAQGMTGRSLSWGHCCCCMNVMAIRFVRDIYSNLHQRVPTPAARAGLKGETNQLITKLAENWEFGKND
jgi:hypothetical protein